MFPTSQPVGQPEWSYSCEHWASQISSSKLVSSEFSLSQANKDNVPHLTQSQNQNQNWSQSPGQGTVLSSNQTQKQSMIKQVKERSAADVPSHPPQPKHPKTVMVHRPQNGFQMAHTPSWQQNSCCVTFFPCFFLSGWVTAVRSPECLTSPPPLLCLVCFQAGRSGFLTPPLDKQGTPETDLLSLSTPAVLLKSLFNSSLFADSLLTPRGTARVQKVSLFASLFAWNCDLSGTNCLSFPQVISQMPARAAQPALV